MTDTQLLLLPIQPVPKRPTIAESFQEFHTLNPHVYDILRREALLVKGAGKRVSMKGLFEHLRWEYMVHTNHQDYKLNNNYTAHYARMLMEREPELAGFFETRRRHDG